MKSLKSEELNKLSSEDLTKRLNELRTDLSRMRSSAARGTLKKELGEIKTVRRNIARILTSINSRKQQETTLPATTKSVESAPPSPIEKEGKAKAEEESSSSKGGKE